MQINIMPYLALACAIIFEVAGSSFLQKSDQFTKLVPTCIMGLFYILSFYALSVALKSLPLGIAYAIWGGMGIVLTAIISVVIFKQSLDSIALLGIGMIVGGVIIINVFSNASH